MRHPALILITILLAGCSYVPPSENKADWFATVENGGPGKLTPVERKVGTLCLKINVTEWVPLLGPDGLGGRRTGYRYWTILEGNGPVFRDPDLHQSDRLHSFNHRGTITIDEKGRKVIIDLQKIVSKPGEPERLEPSPANGSYPLTRWIK